MNQSFDRDEPVGARVVNIEGFEQKCPAHAMLSDHDCWGAIRGNADSEQLRKNLLKGILMEDDEIGLNEATWDYEQEQFVRDIRKDVIFDFSFTGSGLDRVLHVTLTERAIPTRQFRRPAVEGLSTAQRAKLQATIDLMPGKIVLD